MFLNENEGIIINKFLENLDNYDTKEMKLLWHTGGTIIARFDTCFEDENEFDEGEAAYEEFTTFVFEVIDVTDNPPVLITEDNFFCVNYHNFPDEITVDSQKIN